MLAVPRDRTQSNPLTVRVRALEYYKARLEAKIEPLADLYPCVDFEIVE